MKYVLFCVAICFISLLKSTLQEYQIMGELLLIDS